MQKSPIASRKRRRSASPTVGKDRLDTHPSKRWREVSETVPPTLPANVDICPALTDLEPFPILEPPSTQEDLRKWESDMEIAIKNREALLWRKTITDSRLAKFLKLPEALYIWNGETNFPKDMWDTTMEQTKGFNGLLQLFDRCWRGKDRFFRSIYQFMQFAIMLRGERHSLIVLPTGSGKTLPVALYAQWLQTDQGQPPGHIIMLIPYVMLYGQMKQVMEDARVSFSKWELGSRFGPGGPATVIAVSLEHSVRKEFWGDISHLLMEKRIKGLVFDEAHAAVDDQSFRSAFQSLGPRLATLPAPVWLLTATCSPLYEARLWNSLGIYNALKTTITLRQEQEDKDILFNLRPMDITPCDGFVEGCTVYLQTRWLKSKTFDPNKKLLVLTHMRKDVEQVAEALGVDYIHGGVSWDQREHIVHRFQEGVNGHQALVANKACYYGMDIGCISTVIFIGLPDSLLSLQQAVGRAGRHGQAVHCEIMFPFAEPDRDKALAVPMGTPIDFSGELLAPLLVQAPCVDGLLRAFFDGVWVPCKANAIRGIRCNSPGCWPGGAPCSPHSRENWHTVPPPIHITPPSPGWISSRTPIHPPPLSSLAPALVEGRKINLQRNHDIYLWGQSLLELGIFDSTSNLVKCLYCICKGKEREKTTHTWFRCFPSDSKLKNYEAWDKKVLASEKVLPNGRVVYRAKGEWKHHYLPVFRKSSEEESQPSSHMRKENLRPALSAVCGKCHGPVWEEKFHEPIEDSYGPCQHEDLILEVIFVLWAEMRIRKEFLDYFNITEPTFTIHPDDPKGGQFAKWLWSESEVRGWCNAALWAVPWFAYCYRNGEVGRERYGIHPRHRRLLF